MDDDSPAIQAAIDAVAAASRRPLNDERLSGRAILALYLAWAAVFTLAGIMWGKWTPVVIGYVLLALCALIEWRL